MTEEWTAMVRRAGRWEAVGTSGDQDHARSEMADWMKELPSATYAIGYRRVPDWTVTQMYEPA